MLPLVMDRGPTDLVTTLTRAGLQRCRWPHSPPGLASSQMTMLQWKPTTAVINQYSYVDAIDTGVAHTFA